MTRLNKYLAFHLGVSRRKADELIANGSVTLNGVVAEIGAQATDSDTIMIDNQPLNHKPGFEYFLLHKPVGYVCSRRQQGDNPTIYALLPETMHHLKVVGRLDADSSGLVLLTDDGDLALELTHPRYGKTKVYQVALDHPLTPLHQQMISDHGINLEDGVSQLLIEKNDDNNYQITMREGRNRQIRRTFAALGYTVTHLHRTQMGTMSLGTLPQGNYLAIDRP